MKTGIITFHRAHNYGAVLQCYALATTLKNLGHDVEVIDYLPTQFKIEYSIYPFRHLSLIRKITQLVKLLPVLDIKIKRSKGFNSFISTLPLSKKSFDETNARFDNYDVIVFGSDQIWNPVLTNNKDNVYCGNFPKLGKRFVSYAASTNPKLLQKEYQEYFEGIIDRFDNISTRESSLTNYLNGLSNNVSQVVLDPVLLLTKDQWKKIAIKPQEEKYLLVYTVPQHPQIIQVANQLAKEKNLQVIEIRPNIHNIRKKNYLQTVSPTEFLGYIMYADYVLTTSFHGTALSVVFEKQFLTLSINEQVDDRAANLLENLCLSERLVKHNDYHRGIIDYKNPVLTQLRNTSIDFLTSSLK